MGDHGREDTTGQISDRRALQRQADGSWLIVSEMFQAANTETTYAP